MDFPSNAGLANPSDFEEQWEDQGISSRPDDGPEISRARFTKSRGTFKITYNFLNSVNYDTLVYFYKYTCRGMSERFNWVHPVSGITYVVRLVQFGSSKSYFGHGWAVSITLREA